MKKFNFHVKPIGLLDMLHFKQMVPRRRAILQAGSLEPITAVYGVNRLAQSLHPKQQIYPKQQISSSPGSSPPHRSDPCAGPGFPLRVSSEENP